MFSLLHCADLHLEASFASGQLPASVGNRRRADLRAALNRILSLASEQRADAVTIAGDLYEQAYIAPDTAGFLLQAFASLAPIPVYIVPGECDPYGDDSLYVHTRWPGNVMVFSPGPLTPVALAPNIHLWGAVHPAEPGHTPLVSFRPDREGTNLLLLHAAQPGDRAPREQRLFQLDGATLRASGFDVALLGHQHNGRLWREGDVQCIYPGSPEPLSFAEADGDHHVVLLTIDNGICTPRNLPISQWRYPELRVDLSGCGSQEDATALIALALRNHPGGADERAVCRVTLIGTRRFDVDLAALKQQVDTPAYVEYDIQLSAAYDLQQLALEPSTRGLLVRRFQERLANTSSETDRAVAVQALNLALRALDGRQVRPHESG